MLYTETAVKITVFAIFCRKKFRKYARRIQDLGNKKPHGEKEVKPWGNKRRLRFTSRDLKVLKFAEKFNRFLKNIILVLRKNLKKRHNLFS